MPLKGTKYFVYTPGMDVSPYNRLSLINTAG